jgi:hypothetical protein
LTQDDDQSCDDTVLLQNQLIHVSALRLRATSIEGQQKGVRSNEQGARNSRTGSGMLTWQQLQLRAFMRTAQNPRIHTDILFFEILQRRSSDPTGSIITVVLLLVSCTKTGRAPVPVLQHCCC